MTTKQALTATKTTLTRPSPGGGPSGVIYFLLRVVGYARMQRKGNGIKIDVSDRSNFGRKKDGNLVGKNLKKDAVVKHQCVCPLEFLSV